MTTEVHLLVRDALASDLPALSDAHRLGHVAVADARGGRLDTLLRGRAEPIEDTFASDLDATDVLVRIGTANDIVVGYCVTVERPLRSGESILEITELWVHEQARRIGVGSALMNAALATAAERGCTGIDARALPGDRQTKNFFESFGLVARTIEVHRSL